MNLDELQSVQQTERQKDSLQRLRPSFYEEVGDYIAELEAERDRIAERVEDPFSSSEVRRLTDEIETARDVVEAIYERRMGKLVKQASLAAAGLPADDEGLTAEEQDLFDDLVDRIETNKGRVLSVLDGDGDGDAATSGTGTAGDAATGGGSATADRATDAGGSTAGDASTGGDATSSATPGSAPEPDAGDQAADDDLPPPPPPEESGIDAPGAGAADADGPDEGAGRVSAADVMGGGPSREEPDPGSSSRDGSGDAAPGDAANPERDGTASTAADGSPETRDEPDARAGPADDADAEPGRDVDRMTVRITTDVGSILGVDDREYTLEREDVVTLPEQNAEPLVERDAAEPLE